MPIANVSKERISEIEGQMMKAGAIGFLKGTLFALGSGAFFSYRYNYGVNKRLFLTPYKVWYVIVWGVVGVSFAVENAKVSIAKHLAEEENIRRIDYFYLELGGKGP